MGGIAFVPMNVVTANTECWICDAVLFIMVYSFCFSSHPLIGIGFSSLKTVAIANTPFIHYLSQLVDDFRPTKATKEDQIEELN